MSKEQDLAFKADGQIYEVTATPTSAPDDEFENYGPQEQTIAQMERAQHMIRTCAIQAVSAFKDFGAAEVQEVNLKFGVKLGGKAGIPYITEGSAESNLEVSVKCTFPKKTEQKPKYRTKKLGDAKTHLHTVQDSIEFYADDQSQHEKCFWLCVHAF